jgi:hypothetical protein
LTRIGPASVAPVLIDGNLTHVAQVVVACRGAQDPAGAIDLVARRPGHCNVAGIARVMIAVASAGWVANSTSRMTALIQVRD